MSTSLSSHILAVAVRRLRAGGVLAYPTEAVYGLGCDPRNEAAVRRLLALKQRSPAKGLILIAACLEQLLPFLDPLDEAIRKRLLSEWPGPVTWVVPAQRAPIWLRGRHAGLAVRVSAHPLVVALCCRFGAPLVSTSANRAGHPPARTALAVRRQLGPGLDGIVPGAVGGLARPTEIRNLNGGIVRAG